MDSLIICILNFIGMLYCIHYNNTQLKEQHSECLKEHHYKNLCDEITMLKGLYKRLLLKERIEEDN